MVRVEMKRSLSASFTIQSATAIEGRGLEASLTMFVSSK